MASPSFAASLGLLAALGGCAVPSGPESQVDASCRPSEPRTGTLIVRRGDCVASTPESRDAARRQLEAMQLEQERRRVNKAQQNGGG